MVQETNGGIFDFKDHICMALAFIHTCNKLLLHLGHLLAELLIPQDSHPHWRYLYIPEVENMNVFLNLVKRLKPLLFTRK